VIVWIAASIRPTRIRNTGSRPEEAERRVREGMEKGKLSLLLRGEKAKGSFALVRTGKPRTGSSSSTRIASSPRRTSRRRNRSVLSAWTVEDIRPARAAHCRAQLVPDGDKRSFPEKLAADARGSWSASCSYAQASARAHRVHRRKLFGERPLVSVPERVRGGNARTGTAVMSSTVTPDSTERFLRREVRLGDEAILVLDEEPVLGFPGAHQRKGAFGLLAAQQQAELALLHPLAHPALGLFRSWNQYS